MRNQRALAAACTAVAVLGFAAPEAVPYGVGSGGGPYHSKAGPGPDDGITGIAGNVDTPDHFDDNGSHGHAPAQGEGSGQGDDNGNDGRSDESDHRGDSLGRSDDSDHRGDSVGRHDDSGQDDDFADSQDDFGGGGGGGGDDGPRNVVARPGVLPAGGRLAVSVDGCHGGTMSSPVFRTTQFNAFQDDTARGTIKVDRDARPGRYEIRIRCEGRTLVRPAAFTVLGGVQGGVGGGRSSGATPVDMAIGAGLVTLAVVGGGAFWLRRRNEKRT
ncbi:hypothetical protein ABB07_03855 [Streptomyces incarnatus]|uniref:Integral membrane protein n=1 Tax=Streptomyces incarnatus TaxID=665007 RepID=A0ABM5TDY4_9ACTN|nr:hypothetical protein [Streptomyces incarnatus]AKJ09187.1 hypothetical protein ABB07_03855 [Streptomyces incarnatus]